MQDTGILDLGLDPRYAQLAQPSALRRRPRLAAIGAVLAAALLALGVTAAVPGMLPGLSKAFGTGEQPLRVSLDQLRAVSDMNVEDKSQILAKGLDAQQRNAEIPISALPTQLTSAQVSAMVAVPTRPHCATF